MTEQTASNHEPSLEQAMRRALDLARRGPAATPNPRVGCVVLDAAGRIVGEGWHRGAGTPHAEVDALARAGARAQGGTAVVTLEPCNHTGRTGPCSEALLAAGISRVVHAQADPNPVAAGGAARLRAAGVEVTSGLLADQAEALNRSWTFAQRHHRPLVTWKFAATLDGYSAAADGSSQWITSESMRELVMSRRAECGAVVVGTGTALADDPRLTTRRPDGSPCEHQPLRVVVGRRPLPEHARARGDDGLLRQYTTHDPAEVLDSLTAEGVHHVWLEGGPRLAAAFWRAGLVDEVVACLAPALLGAGSPAVADLGIGSMAGIERLRLRELLQAGGDLALVLDPVRRPEGPGAADPGPTHPPPHWPWPRRRRAPGHPG